MNKTYKAKVSIITLGCKVNQYESDSIALGLEKKGYEVLNGLVPADFYVINTCAVTNEGERKSRNQITKCEKLNTHAKIFVCGCAAQFASKSFAEKENVVYVTGTYGKMQIVSEIEKCYKLGENTYENMQNNAKTDIKTPTSVYDDTMKSKQTKTRAFLKVQDGCNEFCSYCIIPYLRGRSRSRSLESVKSELDQIKSKEVVFAGVDMSAFGKDLTPHADLSDLVELMRDREMRFRFSSLEMGSITPKVLKKLSTLPNFCPHFHLSLQSGSDSVLKRMNRKHFTFDYEKCVSDIRKAFPDAAITTDVITGFPLETETEARETENFVKKIEFYEMHIFPYSHRTGTVASRLPALNGEIIKTREKRLIELANKMKSEFLSARIGKNYEILIEEKQEEGLYSGFTPNYIRCFVKSNEPLKAGELVLVKLQKEFKDGMLSVLV